MSAEIWRRVFNRQALRNYLSLAIIMLALGFGLVRWHGRSHRDDPDFQPTLVDIIGSNTGSVRIAH